MPLNDPTAPLTKARQPRPRLLIAGTTIPGVTEVSVTSNNHLQADTWTAEIAANVPGADYSWLDWMPTASTDELMAEVRVDPGDGGPGEQSLIVGRVDHIAFDPVQGTIRLEGRDRTADLIEAKIFEAYPNQTASQIATALAAEHGLTPVVTATTTPVGRYYQVDHDKLKLGQFSRAQTEWDLLTDLAQNEGFDVFVQGSELHFQPATDPNADPYLVIAGPNPKNTTVLSVELERSLTLAKNIVVQVISWNSKQKKGFQVTAPTSASRGSVRAGKAQQYVYKRPNLTQDQAQQLANSTYADLVKHERHITVKLPGEVVLTPRNMLAVQGTGTGWDHSYFITTVTRRCGWETGFVQTIEAKNQSPASEGASAVSLT